MTMEQLQLYRIKKDPVIKVFTSGLAFSPTSRVLDIGCGQGADLSDIIKGFSLSLGGDLSYESLKNAVRLNPALVGRLVQFDCENLPVKSESLEAIYSHGAIHHSPNISESVSEIHRILKPGGRGRVLLYSKYSPKGIAVRLVRILLRGKVFFCWFTKTFPNAGSAVEELFLCPIMDMHTRSEIRQLFRQFANVYIEAWHIGFHHMLFIMGVSEQNILSRWASAVEAVLERLFGFYWIVTFQKPAVLVIPNARERSVPSFSPGSPSPSTPVPRCE